MSGPVDPERWRRVEEVFHAASECAGEARRTLLERACDGDRELRSEVESLLAAGDEADDRIDAVMSDAIELVTAGDDGPVRERIGPYRVLREIGQGGLARVYLAERSDDEFRMRVAIKVVKRGMASADIRRRARQERQILASLDHPHIARLLDGGTTDDGLPYFVLEHIEGEPIDEYCDRRGLRIDERVELVRAVCAAVHCAHQSLVIHRDLKPSNILVTADGTPKLLDFGIAKLLDSEMVPQTLARTMTGMRLLTPEYASPEQIQGKPLTTATDVYSLGVMLYRLLTGHRPYRFESAGAGAIERVICDASPERPSTVIGRTVEDTTAAGDAVALTPESVSRVREGTPDKLRRRLAGDLDTIVLMALRKEPQRRYASVEQLAGDLERSLTSLPVLARRDTLRYRTAKFVRRHRGGVAAAALVAVALLGGIATTSWQALIAERERARAEESLAEARLQSARAEQVSAFLVDLFRLADPDTARGNEATVREVLDDGAVKIRHGLGSQPLLRAELLATMGQAYANLGLFDRALELQQEALETHRRELGEEHPEVGRSLARVAEVRYEQGEYTSAEELLSGALELQRRQLGERHLDVAASLSGLAAVRAVLGDPEDAERLYRQALELRRELLGEDSLEVVETLSQLGEMHLGKRQLDVAESFFRQALERRRQVLGDDHPDVALGLNNLAAVLYERGDHEGAAELIRQALSLHRRIYGDEHPQVAMSLNNLATVLQARGRHDEAEELLRQALAIYEQRLGPQHRDTVAGMTNLAVSLQKQGENAEAEDLFRRALSASHERLGDDHPDVTWNLYRLATFFDETGRPQAAEPLFRQVLDALEPDDFRSVYSRERLARIHSDRGEHAEAETLLRQVVAIRRVHQDADSDPVARAEGLLAAAVSAQGKS